MFKFNEFCDWVGWVMIWIFAIGTVSILLILSVTFVSQHIEKMSWGNYEYIVRVDEQFFFTHDFAVDEYGCVHFIDNYENHQLICEKYVVGEYFLYSNSPNLKSIWFGY